MCTLSNAMLTRGDVSSGLGRCRPLSGAPSPPQPGSKTELARARHKRVRPTQPRAPAVPDDARSGPVHLDRGSGGAVAGNSYAPHRTW